MQGFDFDRTGLEGNYLCSFCCNRASWRLGTKGQWHRQQAAAMSHESTTAMWEGIN